MSESKLGSGGKHGMGGRTDKVGPGHNARGNQVHISTPVMDTLDTTAKTKNSKIGNRGLLDMGSGVSGV